MSEFRLTGLTGQGSIFWCLVGSITLFSFQIAFGCIDEFVSKSRKLDCKEVPMKQQKNKVSRNVFKSIIDFLCAIGSSMIAGALLT